MSTDHPNGGSFLAYPADHPALDGSNLPPGHAQDGAGQGPRAECLAGLDRQYTLVGNRDHHPCRAGADPRPQAQGASRPGADADVTIYTPDANQETMFELPRFVIKAGRILVEQGEIREESYGKTLHVAPDYDRDVEADIQEWFEESYSIRWRNYPVEDATFHEHEVISVNGDRNECDHARAPMTAPRRSFTVDGYVRRGVPDDGRAADRDGRHAGLGRDRRSDDDRLCHQRDRLRRRGRHRARARARARRPTAGPA